MKLIWMSGQVVMHHKQSDKAHEPLVLIFFFIFINMGAYAWERNFQKATPTNHSRRFSNFSWIPSQCVLTKLRLWILKTIFRRYGSSAFSHWYIDKFSTHMHSGHANVGEKALPHKTRLYARHCGLEGVYLQAYDIVSPEPLQHTDWG